MSELIINSKLATAGPGHFELQKYPHKRKLYETRLKTLQSKLADKAINRLR